MASFVWNLRWQEHNLGLENTPRLLGLSNLQKKNVRLCSFMVALQQMQREFCGKQLLILGAMRRSLSSRRSTSKLFRECLTTKERRGDLQCNKRESCSYFLTI